MAAPAPVLVYDGDCGFCTAAARFAVERIAPGAAAVPWHGAGLTPAAERRARHEVLLLHPDGRRVWGGADAVAVLLLSARGTAAALRPVGALMRAPVLRSASAAAYRWVARNRYRMPGATTACRLPDDTEKTC